MSIEIGHVGSQTAFCLTGFETSEKKKLSILRTNVPKVPLGRLFSQRNVSNVVPKVSYRILQQPI